MAITIPLIFMFAMLMSCQRSVCLSEDKVEDDSSGFKIEVRVMKPNRLTKMLFDLGHHEEAFNVLNDNKFTDKETQMENKVYQEKVFLRQNSLGKPDTIRTNQSHLNGAAEGEFLTNGNQNTEIISDVYQPKPTSKSVPERKVRKKGFITINNDDETIWEKIDRIRLQNQYLGGGVPQRSNPDSKPAAETIAENGSSKFLDTYIKVVRNETGRSKPFAFNGNDQSNIIYRNQIPAIPETFQPNGQITLWNISKHGIPFNKQEKAFWTSKRIGNVIKVAITAVVAAVLGIYYCNRYVKKHSNKRRYASSCNVPTREEALRAVPVYNI